MGPGPHLHIHYLRVAHLFALRVIPNNALPVTS